MNTMTESSLAYLSHPAEPEFTGERDFGTRVKLRISKRTTLRSLLHRN